MPKKPDATRAILTLHAEFDLNNGLFIEQIMEAVKEAAESLREQGTVTVARLSLPAVHLDLTKPE